MVLPVSIQSISLFNGCTRTHKHLEKCDVHEQKLNIPKFRLNKVCGSSMANSVWFIRDLYIYTNKIKLYYILPENVKEYVHCIYP